MSRSNRKHQGSNRTKSYRHHNNNSNRTQFKPRHNNNNKHYSQQRNEQRFDKKPPVVEHIKTLPLPKGPLFDKTQLTARWKKARTIGPGFINGQNTCFLNSVLECLTYTPALAQYFLHQGHRKHCTSKRFCAMCAMDDHIHRCLVEPKSLVKGAAILPRAFTTNLRVFSPTLRLGRQEDAHEFMMFLLDSMHKSTIQGYGKLDAKTERTAFIYQIFGGQLQSQLRCHSCNAKSNTFDNFLDLSVDLQQANSVQRALENFIKVDMIGGNDPDTKYRCDSCKQKVNAGKQMTIHELPSMLCVHLKRFTFDMMRGYMRKVTKDIQYTEILDMAPYVSKEANCQSAIYHLYAVLVHLGYGCDSGHYFAYVKAPDGKWFRMDDEDVTPVSLKEVLSQQAYMLFYTSDPSSPSSTTMTQQKSTTETDRGTKRPADEVGTVEPTIHEPSSSPSSSSSSSQPELQEKKKKKKKTKAIVDNTTKEEPTSTMDRYSTWMVESSNKPFRSLRGDLSPPTFAAAVGDISAWTIQENDESSRSMPMGTKWTRRMKRWHITSLNQ
ncbi:hypothetical protein BC941DRAFT_405446 [Chlamydoabsidia padenii]|nr:hypothetical protein BC941DRAFT_405446 [Chlamydoabsidia padenii]